jgi:hypothetical protein
MELGLPGIAVPDVLVEENKIGHFAGVTGGQQIAEGLDRVPLDNFVKEPFIHFTRECNVIWHDKPVHY